MSSADYAHRFCHPDDAALVAVETGAAIASADPNYSRQIEHRMLYADGQVGHIVVHFRIVKDALGRTVRIYGVNQDVTERTQADEHRARLESQLHQAQKVETVGRLAGGVAHDFNNLLTGILGHVALAQMDLAPDDPIQGTLSEVHAAADRAADLTRQLLAFSRKQLIAPKVVDLNALIRKMYVMLKRIIGEDVAVRVMYADRLGLTRVDPGQVEQVIVNLAVNARDAMPKGGTLTIETSNVHVAQSHSEERPDLEPGNYIKISVSDNGEGMDANTLQNVFEPFFTTKAVGKGTGLGLSTVFGIVKQHGGHIEVNSERGIGTSFSVYFQVVDAVAAPRPTEPELPKLYGGNETVLVVEDEPVVRNIAVKILNRHGYTVFSAKNGLMALRLIQDEHPAIDVLLTDVIMPGMNGRELAEKVRPAYPDVKVIFTSGYTREIIGSQGILAEGTDFIAKPYTPAALAKKIREVLDS